VDVGPLRDDWHRWLAPGRLAIFLFHGVIPERRQGVRNYTQKHVDAETFASILNRLADAGTPVHADHAVAALTGEEPLPDNAFLVTFDDGFRNNLTVAAPVLEDLGVPACFYVTSGFVNDGSSSWIDLIEFAVDGARAASLKLPWAPEARPIATNAEKIELLSEVRAVAKTLGDLDPYELAAELQEQAGCGPFEPDGELDAKLSWDEVAQLARHDRFAIGGHSHTHRILAHLSPEELEREVATSLDLLERALGEAVRHYSYPEGLEHCYSDAVIDALRTRGVVCCPTAEPGTNPVGADLFRLRRLLVA
jgi:peptidoglycan/xylan/chitin deacetylase (PgdA/CDA1 family)